MRPEDHGGWAGSGLLVRAGYVDPVDEFAARGANEAWAERFGAHEPLPFDTGALQTWSYNLVETIYNGFDGQRPGQYDDEPQRESLARWWRVYLSKRFSVPIADIERVTQGAWRGAYGDGYDACLGEGACLPVASCALWGRLMALPRAMREAVVEVLRNVPRAQLVLRGGVLMLDLSLAKPSSTVSLWARHLERYGFEPAPSWPGAWRARPNAEAEERAREYRAREHHKRLLDEAIDVAEHPPAAGEAWLSRPARLREPEF